jgi:purine-nucleoside/S-methyl-5'-thioadenosine phosphorylase / adenosine deaminase
MGSSPKTRSQTPGIKIIHADTLAAIPWLLHGFSTRRGGVSEAYGGRALNLGITPQDSRAAVERNRKLFLQALGAIRDDGGAWPSVATRQVHSSVIHRVDESHICQERADVGHPRHPLVGDGLITNRPGIVLAVRVADCLPVLMADPVRRAVGAFHAGWRGTLARIVEKGVGEFRRQFGSDPADLKAAIGPGIHRCCYEVSEDLRDKFGSQFCYAGELFEEVFSSDPVRGKYPLLFMNMRAPGHGEPPRTVHLDLVEANRRQLLDGGVREEHIWISNLCTSCRTDLLFSHRKEKGVTGRMVGAIAIAE